MRKCEVRTPAEALAYITDCNLATVCDMAMKKSRPPREFRRQIEIAQTAVDWMRQMGIKPYKTRAEQITGTVAEWAEQFKPAAKQAIAAPERGLESHGATKSTVDARNGGAE